jgi:hypothetical protein
MNRYRNLASAFPEPQTRAGTDLVGGNLPLVFVMTLPTITFIIPANHTFLSLCEGFADKRITNSLFLQLLIL